MEFIENVRRICAAKGLTVHKVESGCGLGNGIISNSGRGMKAENLAKIASYLGVSMEELMGIEGMGYYVNDETAAVAQSIYKSPQLSLLFDAAKDAKPEDLMTTYNVLLALKQKEWAVRSPADEGEVKKDNDN